MKTWAEHIEWMKADWIGKPVSYHGKYYKVMDVDYNGALLIDKPARFTDTTAVGPWQLDD